MEAESAAKPVRKLKLPFGSPFGQSVAQTDRTVERKRSVQRVSFSESNDAPAAPNSHRLQPQLASSPREQLTRASSPRDQPKKPHGSASAAVDEKSKGEDDKGEDVEWLAEKRREGHQLEDLRHLGASAHEFRKAGFSARQMRRAGYTRDQCVTAGYSHESLNLAGFREYGRVEWKFGGYIYCSLIHLVGEVKESSTPSNARLSFATYVSQVFSNPDSPPIEPTQGQPPPAMSQMDALTPASEGVEEYIGPGFEEWEAILKRHRAQSSVRRRDSAASIEQAGGRNAHVGGAPAPAADGDAADGQSSVAPSSIVIQPSESGNAPGPAPMRAPAPAPAFFPGPATPLPAPVALPLPQDLSA